MDRPATMKSIKTIIKDRNIILKGADEATKGGFTQVPNFVLESDHISPGAKLVYAMLLKYAWQNGFCFPGQEALARDMGCSRRSVIRFMKELTRKEFMEITRRGQGKTNLYILNVCVGSRT